MGIQGASITCECGEEIGVDESMSTVRCRCGATYAMTVTELSLVENP